MWIAFPRSSTTWISDPKAPIWYGISKARAISRSFEGVNGYRPIEKAMDSRRALLGVVIPGGFFQQRAHRRSQAQVQLLLDGSDSNTAAIAQGYAEGIVANLRGAPPRRSAKYARRRSPAGGRQRGGRVWYNPDMVSPQFHRARPDRRDHDDHHRQPQLAHHRARMGKRHHGAVALDAGAPSELALGKLAAYFLVGMVDMVICMLVGVYLFDVPFKGSLLFLTISSFVFLFGSLCTGVWVSATFRTQIMAYQMGTLISFLPGFLLSGFIYSISSMPRVIQAIALFVPARYFINISRGMFLKGIGLEILWLDFLLLAIYGALIVFYFGPEAAAEGGLNLCASGSALLFARNSFRRCAIRVCAACY